MSKKKIKNTLKTIFTYFIDLDDWRDGGGGRGEGKTKMEFFCLAIFQI